MLNPWHVASFAFDLQRLMAIAAMKPISGQLVHIAAKFLNACFFLFGVAARSASHSATRQFINNVVDAMAFMTVS
jgi:hypothetical protein